MIQLADAGGIGLEGVRLRFTAWAYRREHDVTATLEVVGGRSHVTIGRVDGWPITPHQNLRARRHPVLRRILPPEIVGCHVHRFDDNARLGRSAFGAGPEANLPVAAQIPGGLKSFREFLLTVGREFRIDGLKDVEPPQSWKVII
jgi:hypothetical protein